MRIQYPDDLHKEFEAFAPYIKYDKESKLVVLKEDAPDDIKRRYKLALERMHEIDKEYR